MKTLFPEHLETVAKVMTFRLQRQNVVAANLANIKTPGYRAKRLQFEDQLQTALDNDGNGSMTRTNAKHLSPGQASAEPGMELSQEIQPRLVQGLDSVNLDKEMAAMAKNTMLYNALATVLQHNFTGMKDIITRGER